MTTLQLLILLTIFCLFYASIIHRIWVDDNFNKFKNNYIFELVLFLVITLIAFGTVVENNKIAKGCPQLEKLENVYKIKQ
jgi:hypothetical protein